MHLQDFLSYSVLSGSFTALILDVNDLAPVVRVWLNKCWKGRKKETPGPKKWNFGDGKKENFSPQPYRQQKTVPIVASTSLFMIYRLIKGVAILYYISNIQRTQNYSAVMYYEPSSCTKFPSEIVYHCLTLFQCSKWRNWSFSKCKQEIRYLAEIGPVRHIFDFSLHKLYHFKEFWIL